MLMKTLLIYFIITFASTLILLYICHKVIKEDKTKNLILKMLKYMIQMIQLRWNLM